MNLLFYQSLRTVPVGLSVALEFSGPLALTLAATRQLRDLPWIVLALLGLAVLLPFHDATRIDPTGAACAIGAGACWAAYMIAGRRAGALMGRAATPWGMLVALAWALPFGVTGAGLTLFTPAILPAALAVAVLSSALPYPLEMAAMQRLPTRTFGVLLSLDPVVAALAGWLVLGEALTPLQTVAILAIMVASAGTTLTGHDAPVPA
jgi:inner membrane transporter RhtA